MSEFVKVERRALENLSCWVRSWAKAQLGLSGELDEKLDKAARVKGNLVDRIKRLELATADVKKAVAGARGTVKEIISKEKAILNQLAVLRSIQTRGNANTSSGTSPEIWTKQTRRCRTPSATSKE